MTITKKNILSNITVISRAQVPLKYKGEVEVEGIKIQYDGLYITVILPNGIMVTWDGIISTQVCNVTMVTGGTWLSGLNRWPLPRRSVVRDSGKASFVKAVNVPS